LSRKKLIPRLLQNKRQFAIVGEYAMPVYVEIIRDYLKRNKITQTKLADKAGISTVHMSNVMRKKKGVSAEVLIKIADFMGISLYKFFPEYEEPVDPILSEMLEILRNESTRSRKGLLKVLHVLVSDRTSHQDEIDNTEVGEEQSGADSGRSRVNNLMEKATQRYPKRPTRYRKGSGETGK
jgi:transcriptional regulator with XRE-family HTH domain